ncbi:MAG: N-acetyl-gamma-glutamyl-phosphate reductase [Planctomycetota bacterium]
MRMSSLTVGIVGATGYTALEALRWLIPHPQVDVVAITSRGDSGQPISSIHPSLAGKTELAVEKFDATSMAGRCDVVLSCLPHGASAATVRELVEAGTRVIDFSADFRLADLETYENWYGVKHPWPEMLGKVPYGMPEFFESEITEAKLVANPGCYPTSAILPIAPLVEASIVKTEDIIIDSKTGVSGAGRSAKVGMLFCEVNESTAAYGIGVHRHGPEINELVERITGDSIQSIFTPHLTPMNRGILSTIYLKPSIVDLKDAVGESMATLTKAYQNQPFISVVEHLPATGHVRGTHHVQISLRSSGNRLVAVCAIDNLAKGASSAAVQNLNVMFGLPATLGLN